MKKVFLFLAVLLLCVAIGSTAFLELTRCPSSDESKNGLFLAPSPKAPVRALPSSLPTLYATSNPSPVETNTEPIEGVSTSTAGFIGLTERGTERPTMVTGFDDFQAKFGSYIDNSFLAYEVDGFFKNGGQKCYIGRIVIDADNANPSSLTRNNIIFTAIGRGAWGNRLAIRIEDASGNGLEPTQNLFKLTVIYWSQGVLKAADFTPSLNPTEIGSQVSKIVCKSGVKAEVYNSLSIDPQSPNYCIKVVNAISDLVKISKVNPSLSLVRPTNTANNTNILFETLTKGNDGNATAPIPTDFVGDNKTGALTGLKAFEKIGDISILYVPDLQKSSDPASTINDVINQCENLKNRVVIIDSCQGQADISHLSPPRASKYAAFYYPWIKIYDPLSKMEKLVPPGGFVAGIYARTDAEYGVFVAPTYQVLKGATNVEFSLTNEQLETLSLSGVNCIYYSASSGISVWGAHTTSLDPLWKNLSVRRLLIYVEESIRNGTQWVVNTPNNEKLWTNVKQVTSQFLTQVWKTGALQGTTPDEAFFIKCDRSTMTQDDIDNGRLIILIGVSPIDPSGFVTFKIAQWADGSTVTE